MASVFARHSGVQKDVLHLYAAFMRAVRAKQDRAAITEYHYTTRIRSPIRAEAQIRSTRTPIALIHVANVHFCMIAHSYL